MTANRASLEKSLHKLTDKAADCTALAKGQRSSADKLHGAARELENLSAALTAEIADIRHELE